MIMLRVEVTINYVLLGENHGECHYFNESWEMQSHFFVDLCSYDARQIL